MLKKNRYIIYFTDFNHKIGYGHFKRSKSLYLNLKKKFKIYLFSNLRSKSNIYHLFKNFPNPYIIIFDTPKVNKIIFNFYRYKSKTILFDYFGKFIPDYNITIYKHYKQYSKIESFIGLKYIILDKKIIHLKKQDKKKDNRFLVSLGGGDIKKQGIRIANYLEKKGFKVTILFGPTTKNNYKLKISKNIKIFSNSPKYETILNSHTNVITNGGTTMFESIYLNKNIYVLPQSLKENNLAKFFAKKKLILGYGFNNFKKFNIKKFNNLNKNKQNLIDNQGIDRLIKLIIGISQ